MPKFVVEREIPSAGHLSAAELQAISQTYSGVLSTMATQIHWLQSFVTDDKIYGIYIAPEEASILDHAFEGGVPANTVFRVRTMIDPTAAE